MKIPEILKELGIPRYKDLTAKKRVATVKKWRADRDAIHERLKATSGKKKRKT